MDAQSRRSVWELIAALTSDGVTVILTTHLMDEAEFLADHIVIIDHGRLIAEGTPDTLASLSQTAAEIHLTAAGRLDVTEFARSLGVPVRQRSTNRYDIHAAATPALIATIAQAAAQRDLLIEELSTTHRRLEDVFLELTGHRAPAPADGH